MSSHSAPVRGTTVALRPTFDLSEKLREVLAIALVGLATFLLVATATYHLGEPGADGAPALANLCGRVGHALAGTLLLPFGKAAYVLLAFLFHVGILLFLRKRIARPWQKAIGVCVLCLSVAISLAMMRGVESASQATPAGVGGTLGAFLADRMAGTYGRLGTALLLGFLLLVSFLLATDWMLYHAVRGMLPGAAAVAEEAEEDAPAAPRRRRRAAADEPPRSAADDDADEAALAALLRPRRLRPADLLESAAETDPDVEHAPVVVPLAPARPSGPRPDNPRPDNRAARPAVPDEPADAAAMPATPEPAAPPPEPPRQLVIFQPDEQAKEKLRASEREARDKRGKGRAAAKGETGAADDESERKPTYSFPSVDIFKLPRLINDPASRSILEQSARSIEQRLQAFHIGARVVAATPGPAVTQYELELEEGIQMKRIVQFEPDLAAALKAISVRVVAPIPGKDTVGVEVPNLRREMVVLRELLDLQGVGHAAQAIPILLGKDVAGTPIIEDLARMPHLLIAGTTGSGKSVCISSILLSLLMTKTPEDVRLILIDPKMVELQQFKSIPHLLCPVVTNMKKAPGVLEWCVEKMEERYDWFVKAGVNHISLYNQLGEKKLKERMGDAFFPGTTPTHMPYLVLIIDELADLMAVAQQEVEGSIQRLAQKSRAVGIHVILATQSPRRDVVTGIIKANLPCKIAFKVSNKLDSRVILDFNGAEKLLGHGDLLYIPPGTHRLVRAQGTYVNEDEIRSVVDYLEQNCSPARYATELLSPTRQSQKRPEDEDDLFVDGVKVVLGSQRGSATLLQRALNVGYTRASRLLELMEGEGLVGPFVGSKAREVYMSLEAWEGERRNQAATAAAARGAKGGATSGTPLVAGAAPLIPAETADDEDPDELDGDEDNT